MRYFKPIDVPFFTKNGKTLYLSAYIKTESGERLFVGMLGNDAYLRTPGNGELKPFTPGHVRLLLQERDRVRELKDRTRVLRQVREAEIADSLISLF